MLDIFLPFGLPVLVLLFGGVFTLKHILAPYYSCKLYIHVDLETLVPLSLFLDMHWSEWKQGESLARHRVIWPMSWMQILF